MKRFFHFDTHSFRVLVWFAGISQSFMVFECQKGCRQTNQPIVYLIIYFKINTQLILFYLPVCTTA